MCKYEEDKVHFEHYRNEFTEKYFKARPKIKRTRDNERLIEAGFLAGKEQSKVDIAEAFESDQLISAEQAADVIST